MVSPSSHSPEQSPPRKSKTLLIRLFLWIKRFLDERKLPYVANQACRVYFRKEKSSRRKCQSILQTRIELDGKQLKHFLQTSIGRQILAKLSPLFHFPDQPNSAHGLRQLFVDMAGKQEGISLLHLLRLVPEQMQINIDQLMATAAKIQTLVNHTNQLLGEVKTIATKNIHEDQVNRFAELPDLRESGKYAVFINELEGVAKTLLYQPEPLPEKTFVIALSHGLGAMPEDLEAFAIHLASHGYLVVTPQHHGSNSDRLKLMLQGEVDEVFPFSEFGDRPHRITEILDQLEHLNKKQFEGKLHLLEVGVMGHSFGAYTALTLAGATIQFDHLELACGENSSEPNISLLLQCQALGFQQELQDLNDPRVSCICVWDFVGSEIFGQQGLTPVNIPVMAIAGSHDITTPFALEQIRLFRWLQTEQTYLVVMDGKLHVQNLRKWTQAAGLKITVTSPHKPSVQQTIFTQNIQALSLAFFNAYLLGQTDYTQYLCANYGKYLGRSPRNLYMLTNEDKAQFKVEDSSIFLPT
ncbi:hypothetical protein Lepto7376_3471 [[Leptolyngbya] sp. PCC 7376]|uniref:alpha/beta hydrolase n=1 Tax=[Leptolyngbya] sp. PCC 7376 TaxID=111781 RepID=UPI00029F2221|nr:alpha/beta hydrolase [[Leptolyngbya] sp. PCC 7376]AFY39674.1 hypothetical protein Lepto7376_3471 [[Leptolyngbya] sp. PCC 7376]